MADPTPTQVTEYPPSLTEIEKVEIAHALTFHFDSMCRTPAAECREDHSLQYEVLCTIVERMIRRRAGII